MAPHHPVSRLDHRLQDLGGVRLQGKANAGADGGAQGRGRFDGHIAEAEATRGELQTTGTT